MRTRPAVVYFRRKCIKRRSLRCLCIFLGLCCFLMCCGTSLLLALLLAGIFAGGVRVYWIFFP